MGRTFSSELEQQRALTAIARAARTRPSSDRGACLGLRGFAIVDQRVILDTREHDALRPEIDDHLDVAFAVLERLTPALKGDLARDQPLEPTLVGAHERLCGHLVVPTVRVHRAEHDVVVEHRPSTEAADIEAKYL